MKGLRDVSTYAHDFIPLISVEVLARFGYEASSTKRNFYDFYFLTRQSPSVELSKASRYPAKVARRNLDLEKRIDLLLCGTAQRRLGKLFPVAEITVRYPPISWWTRHIVSCTDYLVGVLSRPNVAGENGAKFPLWVKRYDKYALYCQHESSSTNEDTPWSDHPKNHGLTVDCLQRPDPRNIKITTT